MLKRVYLAGPITGCTFEGCTSWREAFRKYLDDANPNGFYDVNRLELLSPMRGKDYISQLVAAGVDGTVADSYPDHKLSCDRGIMTRDYNDCTTADMVLANFLGAGRVSIGTCMEVAWAYQARIPVIFVMEKTGNVHDHSMMREALGFRAESLEEAAHILLTVLWPKRIA
jgi:nucleoside 2-deoxyribosyltransferase